MGLLALVYWCIDKRAGQLMALNVSIAGTMNQGIKNIAKIERPWIQDNKIQLVEAALKNAGAYSFPSGHTTRATATWGALAKALWNKKERCLSVICGLVCLIVAFSGNYLGVHTAKDVLIALLMGVVLIFVLDFCMSWAEKGKYRDLIIGIAGCVIFFAFMLRVGCLSNAGAGVGYPFVFTKLRGKRHMEKKISGIILAFIGMIMVAGVILYNVQTRDENAAQETAAQENTIQEVVQNEEIPSTEAALPFETVKVIAHRGYSSMFPENTMAAFQGACALGADYIETDVQLTKDGVPVLFHDTELSRITGIDGNVIDYTYEELCTMDAGSWFGAEFAGEKIPTLEEALTYLQGEECHIYLELKDIGAVDGFAEKVLDMVAEYGMLDRVVFASFNYDYLQTIKAAESSSWVLYNTASDKPSIVAEYPAEYYGFYLESVSAALVSAAHDAGSSAFVWTVDTPEAMKNVMELGVDGICTNKPELAMVAVCPEYSYLSDNYEGSFSLPLKYQSYVVQGFTKTSYNIFISAYSRNGEDSILFVLNQNGKLLNIVDLGFASYVGGLSYDVANDYLWITGPEGLVYAISCQAVLDGTYSGEILVSFDTGIAEHYQENVVSFLTWFENELFVGSWVEGATGVLNRYDLTNPDEPQLVASMTIPERIKGATFWRNTVTGSTNMYLSQGFRNEDSALLCFEYSTDNSDYAQPLTSYVLPEGAEQIQATAKGLYLLFGSVEGANNQVYLVRMPE